MAAAIETPFTILLHADSEHPLPDADDDVAAALTMIYSVEFEKKKRPPKQVEECLNHLAGVLWLHLHLNNLAES
jgi:hypothetical protein